MPHAGVRRCPIHREDQQIFSSNLWGLELWELTIYYCRMKYLQNNHLSHWLIPNGTIQDVHSYLQNCLERSCLQSLRASGHTCSVRHCKVSLDGKEAAPEVVTWLAARVKLRFDPLNLWYVEVRRSYKGTLRSQFWWRLSDSVSGVTIMDCLAYEACLSMTGWRGDPRRRWRGRSHDSWQIRKGNQGQIRRWTQ